MEQIQELAKIIREHNHIVFFGGAGVSTESGIPDFRSADGLFLQKDARCLMPEQIVSHRFLMEHPEEFFSYYKSHLVYPQAQPNSCHFALAELERMGKLDGVVTQNIDGLHQKAGSQKVYELHGSIHRNHCMQCGEKYTLKAIQHSEGPPQCQKCGGMIRPDVVLYGESLEEDVLYGAIQAIAKAEVLIVGGTSLVVYPASSCIDYFTGKKLVLINQTPTDADSQADLICRKKIGQVFSQIMEIL